MPFCPKCRIEYVQGTQACDDCGTALIAVLPPEGRAAPDDADLVPVWHTQGEMDAQLIRSLLESNGIQSTFSGESLRLTHGLTVDGLAEVRILVRADQAKKACGIIGSLDGMGQCGHCGYPVYLEDDSCYACGRPLGK